MKPYQSSSDKENCSPISSNCIIWQGPNISCINLCKGDSVSDIVYKLAVELCSIQETSSLTTVQFDCLLTLCGSTTKPDLTLAAVLQFIINKICCTYEGLTTAIDNLATSTGGSTTSGNTESMPGGSSEPILDLPACLQYNDPFTGQLVTTLPLTPYVIHLANDFCTLQATVEEHTSQLSDLDGRVTALEDAPCCYVAPTIIPNCTYGSIVGGITTQMDDVVASLDLEYCNLRNTLGTNTQLLSAAGSQCANLGALNALSQSGTMSSIAGWNNTINTVAQSMQNLWLTVCDMRGVINDLKACCGAANCSSFLLGFTVGSPITTDELILVFDALTVIPAGYEDCLAGSTITVTDGNNTFTGSFLLIDDVINGSGSKTFTITIAGLNQYLPWTITVNGCIVNEAGTCSKTVSLVNPAITPTTTTTIAPCTLYDIEISGDDIDDSTTNTVYTSYTECGTSSIIVIANTDTVPYSICVKPGTIPTLYYFVGTAYTLCSISTATNTSGVCIPTTTTTTTTIAP